jgi:hypothetical protein
MGLNPTRQEISYIFLLVFPLADLFFFRSCQLIGESSHMRRLQCKIKRIREKREKSTHQNNKNYLLLSLASERVL